MSFPGTGEQHHKRDLFAYVFPINNAEDFCLRARRTWKFRRPLLLSLSTEGKCVEVKVFLLPLCLWPGNFQQPTFPQQGWGKDYQGPQSPLQVCWLVLQHTSPTTQAAREELLETWISSQLWFTAWFHEELYSVPGKVLHRGGCLLEKKKQELLPLILLLAYY